ncbi:MAG: hypothetical protein Q9220_000836 [cf. Caloplaca sp. 1 TL-2023]
MAPADEDFILTISDNEQLSSFSDAEVASEPHQQPNKNPSKKRKREYTNGNVDDGSSTHHAKSSFKKQKKSQEDRRNGRSDGDSSANEEMISWNVGGEDDGAIDSDFEFQIGDTDQAVIGDFDGWDINKSGKSDTKPGEKKGVDIDALIAKRKKGNSMTNQVSEFRGDEDLGESKESDTDKNGIDASDEEELGEDDDETLAPDGFGMGATGSDEDSEAADHDDDDEEQANSSEDESVVAPVPHPDDEASDASFASGDNDPEERIRREAFFAPEEEVKTPNKKSKIQNSFQTMSLSRPILKGLSSVGFSVPTPIQSKTIPIALLGKDVVGGAVTGSGKTAAFIVPILERLLYRPKKVPTSRVAILMPTRELAVQCFAVAQKLASFTDITIAQLVGGFSLREQEMVLRGRPDIIIATPGRFIDHMRNSPSFTVSTLEILVLDEADRMLDDGFADELNEILTTIPKSRQTMLFSATMTSRIDSLIRLGLTRPVRLQVNPTSQTVTTLTQEFVRLRPGREEHRLAYLLHLCTTVFTTRTIIFFRQKKEAHRIRILFGLAGLSAGELHGNMSQDQRISALQSFRQGQVSHLLATDVASRGLDIKGVETVFNYSAPQNLNIYLHRVGRTARAGAPGRSCTLAAEPDRKVVKAAVKAAKTQGAKVVSRAVDNEAVDAWHERVRGYEDEIDAILKEEKELKQLGEAERDVRKAENVMDFEEEIKSRPKRTWFESEKEKKEGRAKGAVELNGVKEKKGKLSGKDRKRLDLGRERREGRMWKKGKGDPRMVSGSKKGGKGGSREGGAKERATKKEKGQRRGGKR